jgi:hypothetical protein
MKHLLDTDWDSQFFPDHAEQTHTKELVINVSDECNFVEVFLHSKSFQPSAIFLEQNTHSKTDLMEFALPIVRVKE